VTAHCRISSTQRRYSPMALRYPPGDIRHAIRRAESVPPFRVRRVHGGSMIAPALRRSTQHADIVISAALGIAAVVALGMTSAGIGIVRDEGWHILEARHYLGWFRDAAIFFRDGHPRAILATPELDAYWTDNASHPVLVRIAMGGTWLVFTRWLGWVHSNLDGFRLAGWAFAGLSVALTYMLARLLLPRRAAVLAAAMWASLPHVFYHMHLGALDVPVVAAQLWIA